MILKTLSGVRWAVSVQVCYFHFPIPVFNTTRRRLLAPTNFVIANITESRSHIPNCWADRTTRTQPHFHFHLTYDQTKCTEFSAVFDCGCIMSLAMFCVFFCCWFLGRFCNIDRRSLYMLLLSMIQSTRYA